MDLNNYCNFKNHIDIYLKESINLFNLEFDSEIVSLLNESPETFFCLRNKNIIMTLNNIETFPYQDIVPHFYFEVDSILVEINHNSLLELLEINKIHFIEFCNNHYHKFYNLNEFSGRYDGGYKYALYSLNDLILNYYYKLFTGEKSFDDFKFINRV